MPDHEIRDSSTTSGLPIAPALGPALQAAHMPREQGTVSVRVVWIAAGALGIGVAVGFIAEAFLHLIQLFTNLAFYGRLSLEAAPPSADVLGPWIIAVPVVGALVIGVMARYGSAAIRGHGIPEVMEQVLYGKSRISLRILFLKPIS